MNKNRSVIVGVLCGLAACAGPTADESDWQVQLLASPGQPGSAQAHMASVPGSSPLLSWLEPYDADSYALRFSRLSDGNWASADTIAVGDNWFINWADFPSVVPIDQQTIIAHWLVLKPDQYYAYDINYAISNDNGRTWTTPQVLNADEAVAEHGFVSFFPWGEDIGAIWLDGRRLAALTIDELFELEEAVGLTLRYARLQRSGRVIERGEIDELVCDCCQTDAAMTAQGPVVVYRDRTQAEVRDIVVRRANEATATAGSPSVGSSAWSAPTVLGPDNWVIDGCPVNGPAIDAKGEHVVVAWFTAANNQPKIRFARSRDGGREFASAIDVAGAGAFGQVDIVLNVDAAYLSWWQRADNGGMDLVIQRIEADDSLGMRRTIAHTSETLPVDVPQMQFVDGHFYVVWSELGEEGGIHTASAPAW